MPETAAHLLFLNVEYGDGDPEVYLVPISVATGDKSEAILHDRPDVVLARLDGPGPETTALLYGATFDRDFSDSLLRAIVRRRRIKGEGGELVGAHTRDFREAWKAVRSNLEPSPQQTDQCFTVINYGDDFVLKLYRKLEEGINPGREVPEFLCEQTSFKAVPRGAGLAGLPPSVTTDVRQRDHHRHAEQLHSQRHRGLDLHGGPPGPVLRTCPGHSSGSHRRLRDLAPPDPLSAGSRAGAADCRRAAGQLSG